MHLDSLLDLEQEVNHATFGIELGQWRNIDVGVTLIGIEVVDGEDILAQLLPAEDVARFEFRQSQNLFLALEKVTLDIQLLTRKFSGSREDDVLLVSAGDQRLRTFNCITPDSTGHKYFRSFCSTSSSPSHVRGRETSSWFPSL
jgi:hypothetical protein